MTTLQERLRELPKKLCGNPVEDFVDELAYEAADEIERLRARLADAKIALREAQRCLDIRNCKTCQERINAALRREDI